MNCANLTENCVKLVNARELTNTYIYHFLNSDVGRGSVAAGVVGATQPKLPIYNIQRIKILKPTNELIERFSEQVKRIDKILMTLQESNLNITKQRDLLIPRLMSGKLEV